MDYRLEELVDIPKLQVLLEKLEMLNSFTTAILDRNNKILAAAAWQDVCTKFHRVNPESEKGCIKSDNYISEHLNEAKPSVCYKCAHGLMDCAFPIIIDGKHLGNFFIGQFFLEKPDLDFYKNQSKIFGYDEKKYLEAVVKAPIWTKEKLDPYMDFVKEFIELIANIGYKNLKDIEAKIELKKANEKLTASRIEAIKMMDTAIEAKKALEVTNVKLFNEIEEHKQAERKIKETKILLQASIESQKDMIILSIDNNYRYLYFNSFHKHVMEISYGKNIKIGMNLLECMTNSEDRKKAKLHYDRALKGESHITIEEYGDTVRYYYETRYNPILNEKNEIIGATAFSANVTERKRVDEALRSSEALYKAILNASPDDITIADMNGRILMISPKALTMFGYDSEEEIIGGFIIDFLVIEDRERASSRIALKNKGKVAVPSEYRGLRKDGSTFNIEVNSEFIRDKDQQPTCMIFIVRDITERKKAESALRESEEKYRHLIENSHDIIYTLTLDGVITFVSPAWTTLLGQPTVEVVGKKFKQFVHLEDLSVYSEWIKKVIETGQRQEGVEYRIKHFDGTWYWHTSSAAPLKDETNTLIGLEGTARDITGRKQLERTLFDIIDKNPMSIQVVDKEGYTLRLNAAHTQLFGSAPPSNFSVFNDYQLKQKGYGEFLERLKNGEVVRFPDLYFNVHDVVSELPDMPVWISVVAFPLTDNNGNPYQFVFMHENITERKHAEKALRENEEKLSTLFDAMTEMVVLHELVFNELGEAVNYIITDCNKAFTKVTGIKKENAVGKLATDVFNTEIPPYFDVYAQVAITGQSVEYSTYFAPMDKHFMISAVSPKRNQFATITTDITAIQQIQEVISNKNKELENYLYVASHDLRSPLVNIQGFSQRLNKQTDSIKKILSECLFDAGIQTGIEKITNEDIPKTLNFIFSNVAKMDILINGLLQISRTGQIKLIIHKINMNKLLKTILTAFNFQITEVSAQVIVENLLECYGDENLLNQLFSNIISNAIKYRDKDRQLIIKIASQKKYNKVVYSIEDSGLGIATRHLQKIWDVFYRVDSSSSEAGEGIGLSLAKRIIDKHKGKIWAESEEGKGSVFYIELQRNEFLE